MSLVVNCTHYYCDVEEVSRNRYSKCSGKLQIDSNGFAWLGSTKAKSAAAEPLRVTKDQYLTGDQWQSIGNVVNPNFTMHLNPSS